MRQTGSKKKVVRESCQLIGNFEIFANLKNYVIEVLLQI